VLIVLWLVALLVRTLKMVEVAAVVVMEHPFVVGIGEEKQAV